MSEEAQAIEEAEINLSVEDQIEALVTAEVGPHNQVDEPLAAVEEEQEEAPEPEIEINYDQEIPMPDGRDPVTLSALKDRVIELERSAETDIKRENDLMRRTDELKQAIELAGGEIPPELKAQMNARQEKHLQREHDAMLDAMPEWRDSTVFNKARDDIAEVGKQYGISDQELSGIMDHRLIKFMYDHARLLKAQAAGKERIEKLRAVPAKKAKRAPMSTKSSRLNKQIDDAINGSGDKWAAIDAAINAG